MTPHKTQNGAALYEALFIAERNFERQAHREGVDRYEYMTHSQALQRACQPCELAKARTAALDAYFAYIRSIGVDAA
jgi:hypothetical protein